ncbi:sodium-dependent bicarbonate transport family permease, partial [Arthrospira platensis SPKY1]|nr:sodium-dependent bicarbonate transport family permease [Arthrospira platensis SPKY1]
SGNQALQPFTGDLFKGLLAFFLLDMGLVAARRLRDLQKAGGFLLSFAILIPLLNAVLALGLAYWAGLPRGDAFLFVVLCASASYIAVPAAVRLAIPEANP